MKAVLLYALLWLVFATIHSSFARQSLQKRIEPYFKGSYRLLYNVFSLIQFLALLEIGRYFLDTQTFDLLSSVVVQTRFSGLTQIRTLESVATESNETLLIQGLNSWVRHPLYSGAFLYFWGGVDSMFGASTAVLASIYLLVGTHLGAYKDYQKNVPKFFPLKLSMFRLS